MGDFEYMTNLPTMGHSQTFSLLFLNNPNRTVIVANTDAWMKEMGDNLYAFHSILNWIYSSPDATDDFGIVSTNHSRSFQM